MILACEIYNNLEHIDEVWIVPCGDGRDDKQLRSSIKHRIAMIELIKEDLIYEDLPVYINKAEYENGKFMPTWDLLIKLSTEYPNYKFSFCLGSDLLSSLKSWEYGEQIIEKFEIIVLSRPGFEYKNIDFIDKCRILDTKYDNSSTIVRNRIEDVLNKQNKIHLGISGLTSRSVINYIYINNLYKVNSISEEDEEIESRKDSVV